MNSNNYTSLELSQRLVAAGIVLETDVYWSFSDKKLYPRSTILGCKSEIGRQVVPAPNLSELWRELPSRWNKIGLLELSKCYEHKESVCGYYSFENEDWIGESFSNTNPCDALAELLIWVKKGEEG